MDTTLEEVFLKVSEEDQSLENSDAGKSRGTVPHRLRRHTASIWGWTRWPLGSLWDSDVLLLRVMCHDSEESMDMVERLIPQILTRSTAPLELC